MRKSFKSGMWLAAALGLATSARAITQDDSVERYRSIPERNAFGLKPREQAAVAAEPPRPLRKLILTGITTLLGNKRALLKAEPLPGRQGDKEESLILTEGQREGDIEVVQIDEHAGRVTVNNSGSEMTLSFEKDGQKAPALPAGVPVRGTAAAAPVPLPMAPPPTGRIFAGRPPRWPTNAAATPANSAPAASAAVPNLPTTPANPPMPQDLTPEEQAIVLALQQQAAGNNGSPGPPDTTVPTNPEQPHRRSRLPD